MYTFNRMAYASSPLFLEHSQRGDSGRNHTQTIWMPGIKACKATGIRQDASVVYLIVPKTVHAATIDPRYHKVLYLDSYVS